MTDFFGNFYAPTVEGEKDVDFFSPRVNINDNEDHYDIIADLPGVDKKDIHVSLDGDLPTIEASTAEDNEVKDHGQVIRKERRTGQYVRRFTLDVKPSEADIRASFNNVLLQFKVPKLSEKKAESKLIPIQ